MSRVFDKDPRKARPRALALAWLAEMFGAESAAAHRKYVRVRLCVLSYPGRLASLCQSLTLLHDDMDDHRHAGQPRAALDRALASSILATLMDSYTTTVRSSACLHMQLASALARASALPPISIPS